MRIDDIVKTIKDIREDEITDLLIWAVSADFCPFVFEWEEIRIVFKPLSYRSVLYLQHLEAIRRSSIFSEYLPIKINYRDQFISLIANGIARIEYMAENVTDIEGFIRKLHENMFFAVTKIILIINGLDETVSEVLHRQLKKLEDISYAFFSDLLKEGAPSWASPLLMSFQVFRESGKWSAENPIDEPYLLWLAWLAIARGENRYYNEKTRTVSSTPTALPLPQGEKESPIISASAVESLRQAFDLDDLVKILAESEK